MPSIKLHRLVSLLLLYAGTCGAVSAQQTTPVQETLAPLPPPIYQPGELPPLPPPTEEQLQRGRELLEKIVYVIANVPLTDAAAVLKVFGFTNLHSATFPTYMWVGPKGKGNDFAQPAEMSGTGFSYIEVQPWVKSPSHAVTARLSADILPEELCISIDDVRQTFEPITSRVSIRRILDVHSMERPVPLHGIGMLSFAPLSNPTRTQASISFVFEYQTCVKEFNLAYRGNLKEITK
jgi:hypothetical protein